VAREVRELLAALGVRRIEDLIGRTEYLEALPGETPRQRKLDLSPLLSRAGLAADSPQFCVAPSNAPFDKGELAEKMVADMRAAIAGGWGGEWQYEVQNFNRSIGARLSGEIARRWGNYGMKDRPIVVRLSGNVGQSFGAWNAGGLHLYLEGDANDYVGKGMAAGRIVVRPPRVASYVARETTIMGNTCLYGATGGALFAAGMAGERFAVRNSGAKVVVEGCGANGCEYMTNGVAVILGHVGENFGAGMTGGMAFVLDEDGSFSAHANPDSILWQRFASVHWEDVCKSLVEEHARRTDSKWAHTVLADWSHWRKRIWQVCPKEMVTRLAHPLSDEVTAVAAE